MGPVYKPFPLLKMLTVTLHQLRAASGTTSFVITLHIIAEYSSILEPITQAFQAVQLDMIGVKKYVVNLTSMFTDHRENADSIFA
ncbi:hypothetical protein DPMN_157587 [Dreissena polymorpha]|uniref:Uncharacterized protein n=1 Tax=Dreissena polymorpha TaxID=45954 RepID=A0A9D4IL69_DREPO|nr:hypothetical protein DPMN_157587 [Dreissena polymorpha]